MKNDQTNIESQIRICVESQYQSEQSSPEEDRFVFSYTISIQNTGKHAATLLNRHWVITDGNGAKTEVKGKGVIGKQPTLWPGEEFVYTSGTVLTTPIGAMEGKYEMQNQQGEHFYTDIPTFSLASPGVLH